VGAPPPSFALRWRNDDCGCVPPLIGGAHTRLQPVYAEDLTEAVAHILADPGTVGRTCELEGSGVYTLRDLVRQYTWHDANGPDCLAQSANHPRSNIMIRGQDGGVSSTEALTGPGSGSGVEQRGLVVLRPIHPRRNWPHRHRLRRKRYEQIMWVGFPPQPPFVSGLG